MNERHIVKIEDTRLHELFKQNAEMMVFIDSLTDPEMYGWLIKDRAPEVFNAAAAIKEKWK